MFTLIRLIFRLHHASYCHKNTNKKTKYKRLPLVSIFIRMVNTLLTEITMSNVYVVWKWNHFIGDQLQINIKLKKTKINELTFNFNLCYFCFSVNYLTSTGLKNCLKILSDLTFNEVNVSH